MDDNEINKFNQQNINQETNTNNQQNNESINNIQTQKPKKKKKHIFLKILLIIILIMVGIKIFHIVKDRYNKKKFSEFIEKNILTMQSEELELTDEELDQDSNSDGMTNREKIELGLDILSDDTDGDGLTDYDEINIYNSDPKKYSTSGDILGDGYKVQNGYNINEFYADNATLATENENIILTAHKAEDLEAYYKEYDGSIPSEYDVAMKPFRIYSYTGEVNVNIENPDYYEVISYDNINKKITNIKSSTQDNTIIFDIENDNPILIVYKNDILKKIQTNMNAKINVNNSADAEYIFIAMPILNAVFKVPIHIFQVNNFHYKNASNNELADRLNNALNGEYEINVSYISSLEAKIFDALFGRLENEFASYNAEEKSFLQLFLIYKHANSSTDLENYLYDKDDEEEDESPKYDFENKYKNTKGDYYGDSGFSVTKNAFNFSNLSTTVGSDGVCMGISYITTNIYNNGNLAKTMSDVYNLSGSSYDAIWNKQLYSYRAASEQLAAYADEIPKNEKQLDSSKMDKPDSEVVKAIEHYYIAINDSIRLKKVGWAVKSASNKQTFISSKTVDNLVEKFRSGGIVSVTLLGKSQHEINAYKIVEDENDEDILYLKAYDNNLPGDMWWNEDLSGKQKYDVTITLKRCYKNTLFGVKTYYTYDYNPLNDSEYHFGNMNGETDYVIFIDENTNSL